MRVRARQANPFFLCLGGPSHPESSPFVQLMVQYLQRSTSVADPGCLAAAKQHLSSQWVTDGAVKAVLEQGTCSRTAQLDHLAKQVKMPTIQQTEVCAAVSKAMLIASAAKEVGSQLLDIR